MPEGSTHGLMPHTASVNPWYIQRGARHSVLIGGNRDRRGRRFRYKSQPLSKRLPKAIVAEWSAVSLSRKRTPQQSTTHNERVHDRIAAIIIISITVLPDNLCPHGPYKVIDLFVLTSIIATGAQCCFSAGCGRVPDSFNLRQCISCLNGIKNLNSDAIMSTS